MIYINGRFLTQNLSGTQRFAYEMTKSLLSHTNFSINILVPNNLIFKDYDTSNFPIKIVGYNSGIIWEQIDLPFFLIKNGSSLLINLVNTAPILYKFQFVTLHDLTTFINPDWFNKSFSTYYSFILPKIAKKGIKILTVSRSSKNDILRYLKVPKEKVEVLNNGISDIFLNKSDFGDEKILERLVLKSQKFILSVSSLDPRKNFKRLIEAYQLTNQLYPLVIVGAKSKAFVDEGLAELLKNNTNIVFTGYLTNHALKALYNHAICFIYPSLYEGFGIPPLEAMACGCATIVSNTSSMPEICGEASLYIDPKNVESISNAITKLLLDNTLRSYLIKKGFERTELFSWEKSAKKLSVLINDFI